MRTRSRTTASVLAVLVLGLGASACSFNSGRGFEVGVKTEGLNLAFANGPLKTTRVVQLLPQPVGSYATFLTQVASLENPSGTSGFSGLANRGPFNSCPKAPPDARPPEDVKVLVTDPPASGVYTTHNKGRFSLTEGGITISGNFPPVGQFTINNVHRGQSSDTVTPIQGESVGVNGDTRSISYDVVTLGIDGSQTTTTYQANVTSNSASNRANQEAGTGPGTTGSLELVKQVVENSNGTSTFQPQPPITIVSFQKGPGTSWNSAGTDQKTGTTMVVQGSISKVENVDLCGKVYAAYRVISNEKVSNPQTGLSSTTSTSDPNVYDIAPQYGGLLLSQHIDTTTSYTQKNSAVVVGLNYTATLNSETPN
ncbi:MAG TPA: hypothetical protein VE990_19055 [Acidimicrobiales bacterium]|nr:hypothetical protein [Acidimicrobiales bacterium]